MMTKDQELVEKIVVVEFKRSHVGRLIALIFLVLIMGKVKVTFEDDGDEQ